MSPYLLLSAFLSVTHAWAPILIPISILERLNNVTLGLKSESCAQNVGFTMADVCKTDPTRFMGVFESILRREDDLVDHSNCEKFQTKKEIVDFVVVGSGSAGSVVARRLAEAGFETLLLEAGGPAPVGPQVPSMYEQYLVHPEIDWSFELEKETEACLSLNGICKWPRGKVMGGTAQLHGMMYMRGYPQDYDGYAIPGWTWDDVYPYFLKSENNTEIGIYADEGYHGTEGFLTISRFPFTPRIAKDLLAGAAELGYATGNDLNGVNRVGFTIAQATVRNGARLSTARAYLYEAKPTLKNLYIRNNAYVTKVLIENKTAVGVEYEKGNKLFSLRVRKEVILSAGTIQSPQLLLLSGIGPKEDLLKEKIDLVQDIPGVGRNLKNHCSFTVNYILKSEDESLNPLNWNSVNEYLRNRTGSLSSPGLSQITGFLHTKYAHDLDPPDMQIFFLGYQANCSVTGDPREKYLPGYPYRIIGISPTILRPKSVGELKLRNRSPKSPPKINANLLKNEWDVEVLVEGIRIVQRLANTSALRNILQLDKTPIKFCEKWDFDSDSYWKCAIRWFTKPENHQVGTCKMGVDTDEMAVTDPRLRVRGIKNLRVIDASVFPEVPSGNLNAPTIMVAEKGADMVLEDLNFGSTI